MSPAFFLYCILFIFSTSSVLGVDEGVFDKIKISLKNAQTYLETVKNIANLVSQSLKIKQTQRKTENDADIIDNTTRTHKPFTATQLLSTFFRLLGLDSKKVIAVTVNSFIFFAQMISELFKLSPKIENFKTDDEHINIYSPRRLLQENGDENIQFLLKQAENKNLPNQLIDQTKGHDSSCIRLLLCKASPIIWAVQKSLQNNSINFQRDAASWFPLRDEFEKYSEICDKKHSDCTIKFSM